MYSPGIDADRIPSRVVCAGFPSGVDAIGILYRVDAGIHNRVCPCLCLPTSVPVSEPPVCVPVSRPPSGCFWVWALWCLFLYVALPTVFLSAGPPGDVPVCRSSYRCSCPCPICVFLSLGLKTRSRQLLLSSRHSRRHPVQSDSQYPAGKQSVTAAVSAIQPESSPVHLLVNQSGPAASFQPASYPAPTPFQHLYLASSLVQPESSPVQPPLIQPAPSPFQQPESIPLSSPSVGDPAGIPTSTQFGTLSGSAGSQAKFPKTLHSRTPPQAKTHPNSPNPL
ncbi:hypothetical protein E1301_Tti018153 [Triplophysa tibetana]|uniref:Uncharacterized protein n=1 Tax=Triplophysa tibetana TaxID=1572043 RepID=A0A5A9PHJ7_9TELE|nr:hypothetical protein E1301_Tti018153 [Triplophysa tibetana]